MPFSKILMLSPLSLDLLFANFPQFSYWRFFWHRPLCFLLMMNGCTQHTKEWMRCRNVSRIFAHNSAQHSHECHVSITRISRNQLCVCSIIFCRMLRSTDFKSETCKNSTCPFYKDILIFKAVMKSWIGSL